MKLDYELCGADHVFKQLAPVVFSENWSEYFGTISPVYMIYIHQSHKYGIGKWDNGLG